ncbi:MAG: hypothetical protein PHW73_10330 [Atribacterota bacterium]|nr:hypothetical protein [Atribacterota bacterium]
MNKKIDIKDLEKLQALIQSKMKYTPFDKTFGIDAISYLQDGETGPILTIIADDTKDFTWNVFEECDLPKILNEQGWEFKGSYDGIDRYKNRLVEGDLYGSPINKGVSGQFYAHHTRKVLNAWVLVVHNDLDHCLHKGYSAILPSLVYKLAMKNNDIKALLQTNTERHQAVDFIHKYIANRYGNLLDCENFKKVLRKIESKTAICA